MGKKFALTIGINEYAGTDSDLTACINDANDWSTLLKSRGFVVEKLLDGAATGKAMRTRIALTLSRAVAGDVVVITFSGHGSFCADLDGDEADGTDEVICPADVIANGPIVDDDLAVLFADHAPGVRVIFISDSCHSGTVARFAPNTTPLSSPGAGRRSVRFLPPATYLAKRDAARLGDRSRRDASPPGRRGALLLAGCGDTEYSFEGNFSGRGNGVFTYVALRELKKLSTLVTYRQWFDRIRSALPSRQYPQSPSLFGLLSQKNWRIFQ